MGSPAPGIPNAGLGEPLAGSVDAAGGSDRVNTASLKGFHSSSSDDVFEFSIGHLGDLAHDLLLDVDTVTPILAAPVLQPEDAGGGVGREVLDAGHMGVFALTRVGLLPPSRGDLLAHGESGSSDSVG